MRILNKMKKTMLVLAASLFCANVAFADTQTVYSWESPEGTPAETGGTIVYTNGDGERLNYANAGYHTICLNGKFAQIGDAEASANAGHMVLTLDEALKTGDVISITAYRNKNADGKNASIYFLFENGAEWKDANSFVNICADDADADYDDDGATPNTVTWTITDAEADSKTIKMSRNSASTNLFITKMTITREVEAQEPATDDVLLSADMFKTWDSVGADAKSTGAATPEMGIGKEIGGGAMVYGYGTVDPLAYADLTGYAKIIIEGTPGMVIRVLMNRELGGEPGSFNGALVEVKPVIGEDGKAEVDLTSYGYVHLNAMKTDWGSATGTITKISLVEAEIPEVDPELLAAVDTLNVLIAEVEAYQKTLDLTDPMQVSMNESLTTAIADAKVVAEAQESLEAVKNAQGFLNSVYVSVVGGIAGPVIGAAEELMASYENPTDEAGLGAAIQKVYEIYSALGTGMGSVSYTVADLAAAIEAVKAAQEAFIVENSKPAIEYVLHASWNFRDANVFPVDTRVTVASLTEAYDTVPGGIMLYKSTQEEFAGLVFEPAKNDGTQAWWVRQRNTGTDWGLAAINQTRWFAVQNVYEGFKVTVESKSAMKLADSTMVAEFVQNESTASGSGVSYTYIVAKAGMLAFFNEGNYMQSITVEAPVLDRVVDSEWNFRDVNVFPIDTRVTVASLTIPFDTVPGGIMLYESTQEEFAGLVFEPAKNDGTQAWWVRQRNTGTDWGLAAINQTRWFAVKSVKPGYVVTVESKSAMKLADSTMVSSFVQNESTASGSGVSYTYTVAKEGMLAFFNEGNYMQSIKVQKPVTYYEVGKALNFRDEAQFPKDTRVTKESLTVPYDTVPGGIQLYESTDDMFAGLAFEPSKDNNTKSWWVRQRNTGNDYGLAAVNETRWFAVINLKAGERVVVEAKNAMPLADSTVVSEIVQNETTKSGRGVGYTYKMAKNGMLAFQNAGNYMYYIEVQKIGGGLAAPKISVEGNVDDINTVSIACETEGAIIYYSVDEKDTLLYSEPFQVATSCTVAAWSEAAGSVSTVTRKAVTAGFINAPTATITAVDGVNRTVTLASATEGASIVYATSALEEVALTKEMFHKWDGVGADANQTADATTPELGVGVELGAGGMVYGYSTVDYLHYANLTGAVKLVVEGTPGVQLRVLMNRVEHEGALTEVNVTIGTNGKAEVDFTGMEYVHLNAIKTGWGSAAGTITKLAVASVKEGFEAYTEPFVISDNTTVWAIASKKSAIADSLTFASDTLVAELVAGTEVALNAPVFAKAVVDSLTQIEYTEKNLAAYIITANQSSVLCAPTATITYEFYPLISETGRLAETPSLTGEYTDTLKALPLGKLVAKASAAGYASTEAYTWLKAPAVLTPIWEIDFDSLAVALATEADLAPTLTDVVFNGKFRATSSSDFSNVAVNGEALAAGFVLQTGTNWLLRNKPADNSVGLYNYNSGDRAFGFAGLKKNQVVKVSYQDATQAIFMDGVIEQDLANTNGNDVCYNVTADGNATIAMNRYYTLHKVGVYMSSALTQIPDFAITKVDGTTHYVGMTSGTKGADIYYAIGHEEYSESQVLVNDTVGGVAPEYATKIDTTIVYGESKLYTEPVALDKTSYVRAYAWYQDVESEAREQLIEAGMTVQIAQPVILYTGNTEAGEKQFTITVDNSEVISTPTTPIYYTLPGAEEALYDGGTITVKADAYGWMTAVAKLAGYEDSKAARRYIDARESYTEKYEVVDATLETIPAEAGDVEIDYSEEMNVEQLGATAFTGRIYFHRLVEAAVINVSLPTVFNNNCYVTDAAGNKLERGVDYVINEIKAAERPIDGVLTGNMAATAAKGYVVNFLNADLKGKEVIFVSAVKGNIAKANFTYAQPEAGYKVVTNRTFAAVTLDVPAYVLNAEGTAFELVENGAVVAPFQSVILASADICATVGSLSAADGIESIAADKDVKEIKYFTVGGVEVEKPAAGVYIQQIIFTDGTVKSVTVAGK